MTCDKCNNESDTLYLVEDANLCYRCCEDLIKVLSNLKDSIITKDAVIGFIESGEDSGN
jgi:hypothetical protein